jgi:hypothetical protein
MNALVEKLDDMPFFAQTMTNRGQTITRRHFVGDIRQFFDNILLAQPLRGQRKSRWCRFICGFNGFSLVSNLQAGGWSFRPQRSCAYPYQTEVQACKQAANSCKCSINTQFIQLRRDFLTLKHEGVFNLQCFGCCRNTEDFSKMARKLIPKRK